MFFLECERLSNEYPEWQRLILDIDSRISRCSLSAIIRPKIWAQLTATSIDEMGALLDKLTEQGLLLVEEIRPAQDHPDLFEVDDEPERIYRLNQPALKQITTASRTLMHQTSHMFFCYSPRDDTFMKELDEHLQPLYQQGVTRWYSAQTNPGENIFIAQRKQLETADIILLFVTSALGVDCSQEVEAALAQMTRGAKLIPVLCKPYDWTHTSYGHLSPLPANGNPISIWESRDAAWEQVVLGLRSLIY